MKEEKVKSYLLSSAPSSRHLLCFLILLPFMPSLLSFSLSFIFLPSPISFPPLVSWSLLSLLLLSSFSLLPLLSSWCKRFWETLLTSSVAPSDNSSKLTGGPWDLCSYCSNRHGNGLWVWTCVRETRQLSVWWEVSIKYKERDTKRECFIYLKWKWNLKVRRKGDDSLD